MERVGGKETENVDRNELRSSIISPIIYLSSSAGESERAQSAAAPQTDPCASRHGFGSFGITKASAFSCALGSAIANLIKLICTRKKRRRKKRRTEDSQLKRQRYAMQMSSRRQSSLPSQLLVPFIFGCLLCNRGNYFGDADRSSLRKFAILMNTKWLRGAAKSGALQRLDSQRAARDNAIEANRLIGDVRHAASVSCI